MPFCRIIGLFGIQCTAPDFSVVPPTRAAASSRAVSAPALLAVADARPGLEKRMAQAFAIGVAVNVALGRVMGFSHYNKGWHATSTLGPIATAAALAHLLSLDEGRTRRQVEAVDLEAVG